MNISLGYQNRDIFVSAQYYQNYTSNYQSYGLGIYGIKNFWFKVDEYEYPWANFFVGVQPSLVHYLENKAYTITTYPT